jgi:hypothetical protein
VYLAPDDAKSDVILVGAVVVFGEAARGFVAGLPLYPQRGLAALVLSLAWMVALTGLVPVLLARYRGDRGAAFGMGSGGGGTGAGGAGAGGAAAGLVLALPVAVLGFVLATTLTLDTSVALLGQWLRVDVTGVAGADAALGLLAWAILTVGTLLVVSFLGVRGREGYPRSPEASLTALVRSLGMGAAGVALVLGLVRAVTGASSLAVAVTSALAGAAVVLLADRLIPAGIVLPRTAVVAPVVVVAVANLFATGGLFRGDLLGALYLVAMATPTIVAVAALAQTRRGAWAALPLVAAVHWWPTCLAPLPMAGGLC